MMPTQAKHERPACLIRAFTLVESVISLVIVGVMLVAALNTVGASRLSQYKTSTRAQGRLLAESLLAEIFTQRYADPNGAALFGVEVGEDDDTREVFDDVDDYHTWTSSPPTEKTGTEMALWGRWRRSVTVEWVDPANPALVQGTESLAKRVTVKVHCGGMPVATLVAIKTDWEP